MAILWNNVVTTPNRWMAYWLRRRGWVCFYLDEQARHCYVDEQARHCSATCWLALYQEGEKR